MRAGVTVLIVLDGRACGAPRARARPRCYRRIEALQHAIAQQ